MIQTNISDEQADEFVEEALIHDDEEYSGNQFDRTDNSSLLTVLDMTSACLDDVADDHVVATTVTAEDDIDPVIDQE